MKVQSAKLALYILLLAVLPLLSLSSCGVLEVDIERPATQETITLPPPTNTIPAPTKTPLPGQLEPGQAVRIIQIHMLNRTTGWAIGQVETDLNDHILFTTDGGQSWQDHTPLEALLNPPAEGLAATTFFGADGNAWVIYASQSPQQPIQEKQAVWHTADNGKSWQAGRTLSLSGFQAEYFIPSNLGFLDEQHGWVMAHVGAGMSHDYIVVFTTSDGGQTWQRVVDADKNPDLMGCSKTGLAFSIATNGWLTGNCPGLMDHLFLYSSIDGGQTWQPGNIFPPTDQPADLFSDGKAGCGVPDLIYVTARSTLLTMRCEFYNTKRTVAWLYVGKAGGTLEAHLLPTPFGAFDFIDTEEGWMVGTQQDDPATPGEIYHTIDGGQSWTLVLSTAWQGTPDFIDSNTGWVVAHASDKLALVFTNNGGKLWEKLSPVITR